MGEITMKSLKDRVLYIILTGAKKCSVMPQAVKEFINQGAKTYTFFTEMGRKIADLHDFNMPGNTVLIDYNRGDTLPLEDLVLVAPCTFNTLNKISNGVADSYPLTIVASAIGGKRNVLVAPAMNLDLWQHPQVKDSIEKLKSWGCQVMWPEISNGKSAMAAIEKVADGVYYKLNRIRYPSQRVPTTKEYSDLVDANFDEFNHVGVNLAEKGLTCGSAGCFCKRVGDGNQFLVTSTGAHVGHLSKDEVTLVKGVQKGKVFWMGNNFPSSETPLLHEILSEGYDSVIHGHCPSITYAPYLNGYASESYVRYGTFGESRKIIPLIKGNGFAILRAHGEISTGKSLDEALKLLVTKQAEIIRLNSHAT